MIPKSHVLRSIDQYTPITVSPHEFGDYVPNGVNPVHPDIPSKDAYQKRTSLFLGNHAILPLKRPVTPKLESIKTKSGPRRVSPLFKSRKSKVLRNVPPRGICAAIAACNAGPCSRSRIH